MPKILRIPNTSTTHDQGLHCVYIFNWGQTLVKYFILRFAFLGCFWEMFK